MDPIMGALLEYGSMGLFAAFLVWQHLSMQKRFDKLVDKFQGQLEGIQVKAEANEDKLRSRYDEVITGLQTEKTDFKIELNERIKDILLGVEKLPFKAIQMSIEGLSLNQENMATKVNKIIKNFEQKDAEEKIKAMAKNLARNNEG